MKRKILSTSTILALVLSLGMAAVPAGPVLALKAPLAAEISSPTSAAAVSGTVWAWGGQTELGDGTVGDKKTPVQVSGLSGVTAIAAGRSHALAVKSDGTVWAWGLNSKGQLGDGTTTRRNTPVKVNGLTDVMAVAAGDSYSLALKSDGSVWAWGLNDGGQLGYIIVNNSGMPVDYSPFAAEVNYLVGVKAVAAGDSHSLALKSDGSVWTWGHNEHGELGDPALANSPIPVQVPVGVVQAISAAIGHSLAVKSDGTVWSWGTNPAAQAVSNTGSNLFKPVIPADMNLPPGIAAVAAGMTHELALMQGGTVYAWGGNTYGKLGFGSLTPAVGAGPVSGLTGVTAVAAGRDHSLALKSDGSVWAWGYNYYGQVGDDTTTNRFVPVQVKGLTDVKAVAANNFYSLALKADALTAVIVPAPITVTPQPLGAPTTTVYMSPQYPANPGPGGMYYLSVMVDTGGQLISSADITVVVNSQLMHSPYLSPGSLFGANPVIVPTSTSGSIKRLVIARASGNAQTETEGSLALFRFDRYGSVSGNFTLGMQVKLSDANGQDIKIDTIRFATITIGPGSGKMGDINSDGLVDYRDLALFVGVYGTRSGQGNINNKADLNGDSWINHLDLAIFGANYGK